MDSNGVVVAPESGWSNFICTVLIIGAYYTGVYIQHLRGRYQHQVSSVPLHFKLLLGVFPCLGVMATMGPIVECTLAGWSLYFSLALIGEQGFLVEHFFTRLTTRSA